MSEHDVSIRVFEPADALDVIELLTRCGLVSPNNPPGEDLERKVQRDPEGLLVAVQADRIVGSIMAGYEGHRGWINYLAVDPEHRRGGLGRRLMAAAECYLKELGCPKVNLQVRGTNREVLAFYAAAGYSVEDRVSLGKRLG